MFLLVLSCFFRRRKQIVRVPHRLQVYLLPLGGGEGGGAFPLGKDGLGRVGERPLLGVLILLNQLFVKERIHLPLEVTP